MDRCSAYFTHEHFYFAGTKSDCVTQSVVPPYSIEELRQRNKFKIPCISVNTTSQPDSHINDLFTITAYTISKDYHILQSAVAELKKNDRSPIQPANKTDSSTNGLFKNNSTQSPPPREVSAPEYNPRTYTRGFNAFSTEDTPQRFFFTTQQIAAIKSIPATTANGGGIEKDMQPDNYILYIINVTKLLRISYCRFDLPYNTWQQYRKNILNKILAIYEDKENTIITSSGITKAEKNQTAITAPPKTSYTSEYSWYIKDYILHLHIDREKGKIAITDNFFILQDALIFNLKTIENYALYLKDVKLEIHSFTDKINWQQLKAETLLQKLDKKICSDPCWLFDYPNLNNPAITLLESILAYDKKTVNSFALQYRYSLTFIVALIKKTISLGKEADSIKLTKSFNYLLTLSDDFIKSPYLDKIQLLFDIHDKNRDKIMNSLNKYKNENNKPFFEFIKNTILEVIDSDVKERYALISAFENALKIHYGFNISLLISTAPPCWQKIEKKYPDWQQHAVSIKNWFHYP